MCIVARDGTFGHVSVYLCLQICGPRIFQAHDRLKRLNIREWACQPCATIPYFADLKRIYRLSSKIS